MKGEFTVTEYNLQSALRDANNERALIYLDIFREIRERHGEKEAIDIIRAALETRGRAFGKTLKKYCLLYTSPSPRDGLLSRMPSSA